MALPTRDHAANLARSGEPRARDYRGEQPHLALIVAPGAYNRGMDARPYLLQVVRAMNACGLDAVLIGNAGAALHGAPVTTVDFDFFFRGTPANVKRLKQVAKALEATILRP